MLEWREWRIHPGHGAAPEPQSAVLGGLHTGALHHRLPLPAVQIRSHAGLCIHTILWYYFLKRNLKYISPLCRVTDSPIWEFWWHLPWVSWILCLHASSSTSQTIYITKFATVSECNGFLRFTSGVTPTDLLIASMAAESFWSTYMYKYCWDSNSVLFLVRVGGISMDSIIACKYIFK